MYLGDEVSLLFCGDVFLQYHTTSSRTCLIRTLISSSGYGRKPKCELGISKLESMKLEVMRGMEEWVGVCTVLVTRRRGDGSVQ